jgi:hypothetical protein
MGHTLNGKGDGTYQLSCQTLAGLGYLVLGFDPMGQGERTYYPDTVPSRSRLGADEEHTYPGRQMVLKGITSTRLQTWDSVRSLDYLASHPLVDPNRLASTGQSGGGTTTMMLAGERMQVTGAMTGWFLTGSSLGGMSLPWGIGQAFVRFGARSMPLLVTATVVVSFTVPAGIPSDVAETTVITATKTASTECCPRARYASSGP